ncbi:MAG: putative quinol monooxygenase [Haliangiales bacterium]
MLIVAGTIVIDPAHREAAIAAATKAMHATRAEAGCISYTFSADFADPGGFYVFEEWESEEALAAHFKTPHMAEFVQALGALGVKRTEIKRYEVSSSQPLKL